MPSTRKLSAEEAVAGVRAMRSPAQIAAAFNTSHKRLNYHLYPRPPKYRTIHIPKKNGGLREIRVPPEPIAIWQKILADHLRDAYRPRNRVHGFCLDKSIRSNAEFHVGKKLVLNLDLKDFFPSINFGRVRGMFKSLPFEIPEGPASILARLCCDNGHLPQGAPTSPAISNWICRSLDRALARLAWKYRCECTRYADDITFSTNRRSFGDGVLESFQGDAVTLGSELRECIESAWFEVNSAKIWVRTQGARQEVTGLVVNRKVNVRRTFYRNTRAALHQWQEKGYKQANARFQRKFDTRHRRGGATVELRDCLRGRLAFMGNIRGEGDRLTARYAMQFRKLLHQDSGVSLSPVSIMPVLNSVEWRRLIEGALLLVEVASPSGEEQHGTAFRLSGVGLVTCWHVVEKAVPLGVITVRSAMDLSRTVKARVVLKEEHFDLAVIEADLPSIGALVSSGDPVQSGDKLLAAGFPNWERPSDGMWLEETSCSQKRVVSTVERIRMSTTVSPGASGGPIFKDGRVVGVITDWSESPRLANSGVSIKHLAELSPISGAER